MKPAAVKRFIRHAKKIFIHSQRLITMIIDANHQTIA